MAQPCSIQDEEKTKQLKDAVDRSDSWAEWKRYLDLCNLDDVTPKDILTDISYYENVEKIEPKHVNQALNEAIDELYNNAKNEDPKERAKRRGSFKKPWFSENLRCGKCKGRNIIYINAGSGDGGIIMFASGIEHEGYFPNIPNLCGGDDVVFHLCVNCGILVGFKKEEFAAAVMRAEYLLDRA